MTLSVGNLDALMRAHPDVTFEFSTDPAVHESARVVLVARKYVRDREERVTVRGLDVASTVHLMREQIHHLLTGAKTWPPIKLKGGRP